MVRWYTKRRVGGFEIKIPTTRYVISDLLARVAGSGLSYYTFYLFGSIVEHVPYLSGFIKDFVYHCGVHGSLPNILGLAGLIYGFLASGIEASEEKLREIRIKPISILLRD